jgi:hypothetical protein
MEDDGTVNMMKQPSSSVLAPVTPTSISSGSSDRDYGARVDLDYHQDVASGANYGSLKDLLPVKRLTWTKLDFKGASVEDERRMKKKVVAVRDAASAGGDVIGDVIESNDRRGRGLKELLPVRPTWTKLDFRGASVEDERRTKRKDSPQSSTKSFNEGQYSNLKTLLPERTITFRQGQVFSSGSATMVNSNVMRLPRLGSQQQAGDNDVSQQQQHGDEVDDGVSDSENTDKAYDSMQEKTTYTNLKDLLPERKMSWRTTK